MKITLIGILAFLVLVAGYFVWFGGPLTLPDDPSMTDRGIVRSWYYCSLLFVAGAGTACFGDKEYGMFPPTSLRWLFIFFGIVIMAVSATWMHSLKKAWADRSSAVPGAEAALWHTGKRCSRRFLTCLTSPENRFLNA
jgi:hypothetical protein